MAITRKNHYVPQLYLKNFADSQGYLYRYQLLTSKPQSRVWKRLHTENVAYHFNLYTFAGGFQEDDDLERWFCKDFELKAASALDAVCRDAALRPEDWRTLIDFAALQIVRTPAFYARRLPWWNKELPQSIQGTMDRLKQHLEAGTLSSELEKENEVNASSLLQTENVFPLKVTREDDEDADMAQLKAETIVGRPMWRYEVRHLLSYPKNVLYKHRWTILHAPPGFVWPTTDDPVLTLNYNSPQDYTFGGGWDSQGSEILLPIDSTRMLYTRIGSKVPQRGTEVPLEHARMMKRLIVRHAFKEIYSASEDTDIPKLRPQTVNAEAVRDELKGWSDWHADHSAAEQDVFENHRKKASAEPGAPGSRS